MNKESSDTNLNGKSFYFTAIPLSTSTAEQANDAIKIIADSSANIRVALDYLSQTQAYTELGQDKSWGNFLKQSIPDLSIRLANQLLKLNSIERNLKLGKPIGTVPIEALKILAKVDEADRADVWVSANNNLIPGGSILHSLEQELADRSGHSD